ncbi:MAG: FimB/Mfa2 family fimbrial subunit [Prevotella sp.]|nr:FimB/Mfa2 family fimbrial subunit [Prevotella sp.]
MKKYISLMAIAIVAVFSSCSNDDVTISRGVTIKVNPAGVISPFPEEWEGELTTFDSSHKLRVRVLAYDQNGLLVLNESNILPNYKTEMTTSGVLAIGSYTVLAITDLYSSESEYWKLSNEKNINTATISAEYVSLGGKNRLLGFCAQKVNITENTQSVTISPTPAGALLRMRYYNVLAFNDVKYFGLMTNRSSNAMSFDSNGNPNLQPYTSPDGTLDVLCSVIDVDNAEGNNLYSWYFLFPQENISFQFLWEDANEIDYDMGDRFTIPSIKAGEEWLLEVDCYTDEVAYQKFTGAESRQLESKTSKTVPTMIKKVEQAKVPSMFPVSKSMKLKDLIQK